jgi:hypothetical protein
MSYITYVNLEDVEKSWNKMFTPDFSAPVETRNERKPSLRSKWKVWGKMLTPEFGVLAQTSGEWKPSFGSNDPAHVVC